MSSASGISSHESNNYVKKRRRKWSPKASKDVKRDYLQLSADLRPQDGFYAATFVSQKDETRQRSPIKTGVPVD